MAKTTAKKDSALQTFFKENKSLALMLPLLAVLIIAMIIVYASGGKDNTTAVSGNPDNPPAAAEASIPSDQPKVEVLPQIERQGQEKAEVDVTKDPFEAPMKLSGILTDSDGKAMAIIESGGVSYIVQKEGLIGESTWKVLSIYESSVMLDSNGRSMLLELNASAQSSPSSQPVSP